MTVELHLGDCLEFMQGVEDKSVDLVFADPPYGIGAKYEGDTDDNRGDYWNWTRRWINIARRVSKIVVLTHKVKALQEIIDWDWVGVWNKPYSSGTRMGNSGIIPHYEPVFMYGIHSMGVKWTGFSDVFTCNPVGKGQVGGYHGRVAAMTVVSGSHRFQKPLGLMTDFLTAFSLEGQTILDPFMGSGTTGVACVQSGRNFIGCEISPEYFAIAEKRIQDAQDAMEKEDDNRVTI